MSKKETNEIMNRTKIRHILYFVFKRHLFRWPFYAAIILTFFSTVTLHWSKPYLTIKSLYHVIGNHLDNITSISISSLSIVIAAFAIIFIIYSRGMLKVFINIPGGMEGFISPYIWAAIIWCALACISFYSLILISKNNLLYLSIVFLFYYGSMLMIYLLLEILQHLMLSLKH